MNINWPTQADSCEINFSCVCFSWRLKAPLCLPASAPFDSKTWVNGPARPLAVVYDIPALIRFNPLADGKRFFCHWGVDSSWVIPRVNQRLSLVGPQFNGSFIFTASVISMYWKRGLIYWMCVSLQALVFSLSSVHGSSLSLVSSTSSIYSTVSLNATKC